MDNALVAVALKAAAEQIEKRPDMDPVKFLRDLALELLSPTKETRQ